MVDVRRFPVLMGNRLMNEKRKYCIKRLASRLDYSDFTIVPTLSPAGHDLGTLLCSCVYASLFTWLIKYVCTCVNILTRLDSIRITFILGFVSWGMTLFQNLYILYHLGFPVRSVLLIVLVRLSMKSSGKQPDF